MVARLIDPACCHRTAPCPHQLGEGMTGSRTHPALPQPICASHLEKAHNHISAAASLRHPPTACTEPGPASRPFVLAALRALRLDPGSLPSAVHIEVETSKNWSQPLTKPRPFRDDYSSPLHAQQLQALTAQTTTC